MTMEQDVHASLLELVDKFNHYYNPCQMKGDGCLVGKPNPCCINTRFNAGGGCHHLKDTVCTNPNVSCKVWFCETALNTMSLNAATVFRALETIAKEMGLMHQPYLGEHYFGADKPLT
jgi:hypothetical protein